MFDIFKQDVKIGDKVKLYLTTGKEPEGSVVEIGDNYVLLQSDEQTKSRFFDKMLGGWDVLNKTVSAIKSNENKPMPIVKDDKPATSSSIGIKIVGKIPLESLEKTVSKKSKTEKPKGEIQIKKGTVRDFSDLHTLLSSEQKKQMEDNAKLENELLVSANGYITKYFADRQFGFILDKFGYEIYFHASDIRDSLLSSSLISTSTKLQLPVLFTLSKNSKGDKAILIHKPKTVSAILDKAKSFVEKKDYNMAIGFIEQIFSSFPNNDNALKLHKQIKSEIKPWSSSGKKIKSYDINYQKAVKAKNIDKDFDSALKYYMLAFENNEKRESCIKDIGMLYVQMGEPQKALEFIDEYEEELQDTLTTYNYLANFYSSVKEFDRVIEYVDLLLEDKTVARDKKKMSLYLSQKGFSLIQLGEKDNARPVLDEALGYLPENTYVIRLLQALDEPDEEKQSQIIAEAEFDSFGGGLSKFVQETLNNYDEYLGIPAKVIDTGDFTHTTLKSLRDLIDTAGRARPRERANYLLTEAKLMISLEPEKESSLKSVLARYCNAMALNHASENSSMDVIRNYYLEAFGLEENYRFTAPQVALFLISYKSTYSELLGSKTPSVDEALNYIIDQDTKDYIWEGLLSMFLWNRSISANVIGKLFNNLDFRDNSTQYLLRIGVVITSQNVSLDDYINFWNGAREIRQRDYRKWLASVKAIYLNDNLEVIVNQLKDSISDLKKNWLTTLDTSRLTILTTDIVEVLTQYLKQNGYRDKERLYGNAKTQVNQLISEFREQPTKLSYEGFVPLLEKIILSLDNSFKSIEAASIPVVKVSILGEEGSVVNQEDKTVFIKVQVENSKNSSPIRDISVFLKESDEVKSKDKADYSDSVDGGEHCELQLKAELSDKVIQDKATTINIATSYKIRNQEESVVKEEQLSLRLYSEEEFETIPNPYERLANGGPVTDTKMFYGRNEIIKKITEAIITTDSKQVVIYGQKRSGKSSVLYHLKKSLEATNKTFCISFSIGNIFENISTETFFYKITDLIAEELENYNTEVPIFKSPTFSEFKEAPNPADFFRKQIRLFKKACSTLDEWKDKKIVIMIDEFTYIYTAIKKGKISDGFMKQWKAITQNEDSMFSSVLVGQDIFPMFKEEFPNEFGITQDERLTYLSKEDAVRLIEEPIGKTKSGGNRFIGDALETIIDYTSCNPYYIQIFCARLVSEMNRKKYIQVTSADVKKNADSFINGGQALTDDKFDNLLNAGEEHDIQRYKQEVSKEILKNVATNAKFIGFCKRDQISIKTKDIDIDEVLKDLVKREVLEQREDSYKIQVKLFQEWLLKH
ncbi:AAA+ ATPase superfamily predicted ATPase [Parabacteroides sp. PFB2-12]|uniref:hypothetical protein n=1 Tax=unclassified Parabacteroides TaxID=2649774 RepID=UPI00247527B7|nr:MULTISPECIES: hypothetical protein [unclassified Parabacteroides]MDH6341350.1 AAA+ ATPase superfamily predicted ATPase [Parabacteroides sp. PM6-13]MDH6389144.1 AAA+ ATPase superfamily predicted ATPase [Parabacteroides sp. PFB2-12]